MAATALPAIARADGPALSWSSAAGCDPQQEKGAAAMQALADGLRAAKLHARVSVASTPNGRWSADVDVSGGSSVGTVRRVEGESCAAVVDAASLILTMALSPEKNGPFEEATAEAAVEEVPKVAPVAPPKDTAVASPPPPAIPRTENDEAASPPAPRSIFVTAAATFGLAAGLLPLASAEGALVLGARWRFLSLEIGGAMSPTQRRVVDAHPTEGASFGAYRLQARACALTELRDVELGACATGGAAWLQADGFGSAQPKSATGTVGMVGAGGRLAWPALDRWALTSEIFALAPTSRPLFVIDNTGIVHQPAAFGMALAFGVRARF